MNIINKTTDFLFYYFYLFFNKIFYRIDRNEGAFTATTFLGGTLGIIIVNLINAISTLFFKRKLLFGIEIAFAVFFCVVVWINIKYLYFGRFKQVISMDKPIFISENVSIVLVVLYVLIFFVTMFTMPFM